MSEQTPPNPNQIPSIHSEKLGAQRFIDSVVGARVLRAVGVEQPHPIDEMRLTTDEIQQVRQEVVDAPQKIIESVDVPGHSEETEDASTSDVYRRRVVPVPMPADPWKVPGYREAMERSQQEHRGESGKSGPVLSDEVIDRLNGGK